MFLIYCHVSFLHHTLVNSYVILQNEVVQYFMIDIMQNGFRNYEKPSFNSIYVCRLQLLFNKTNEKLILCTFEYQKIVAFLKRFM